MQRFSQVSTPYLKPFTYHLSVCFERLRYTGRNTVMGVYPENPLFLIVLRITQKSAVLNAILMSKLTIEENSYMFHSSPLAVFTIAHIESTVDFPFTRPSFFTSSLFAFIFLRNFPHVFNRHNGFSYQNKIFHILGKHHSSKQKLKTNLNYYVQWS